MIILMSTRIHGLNGQMAVSIPQWMVRSIGLKEYKLVPGVDINTKYAIAIKARSTTS
jgi:hypothetical protein